MIADASAPGPVESGDPFDFPLGGDPSEIAGAEDAFRWGVAEEGLAGQVRAADIAASHAHAADADLADLTWWQDARRVAEVQDDCTVGGQGAPQRRCLVRARLAPQGGDGRLRRPVQTDEPPPRTSPGVQELRRSLHAAEQDQPQARELDVNVGQERWVRAEHGDSPVTQEAAEGGPPEALTRRRCDDGGATGPRQPRLEHPEVGARARVVEDAVAHADVDEVADDLDEVGHRLVADRGHA
ncbi:hypothetical protein PGB27_12510 [Actinomycetospora sp. DW7H6]|uniref:DUF222 domain-containing protein n=1 Tax=Actinomycetospora lemnae TaxID=3019891 RepID=A0ABT5STJ1_9PSEU|nr:hypothetical protein [Actinomycetospora sp. DW7H6]MDD7966162.1 hypothetical protein [Actinomycetospora sp. DW7H6]